MQSSDAQPEGALVTIGVTLVFWQPYTFHSFSWLPGQVTLLQMSDTVTMDSEHSAMSSLAALRLRERLAKRPRFLEEAAAGLGVKLRPKHRKLLRSLSAAGPPNNHSHQSLLQAAAQKGAGYLSTMATNLKDGDRSGTYEQMGEAGGMVISSLITGEPPDMGSIISSVGGILTQVAMMANPLLGMGFALVTSVLGGLFGGGQDNAMQELYEKIMEEVKNLITEKINAAQAHEFRTEFQAVITEMGYMTTILEQNATGAAQGFEAQLELVWYMMLHRDLVLLRQHFLGGDKCLANKIPPNHSMDGDCFDWHKQCFVLDVVELVFTENNIMAKIAELEPSWAKPVARRASDDLAHTIDVMSAGQWACMAGILPSGWGNANADRAEDAYKNMWARWPGILGMSMRPGDSSYLKHKDHFKGVGMFKDFGCMDRPGLCGDTKNLISGVYFTERIRMGDLEHFVYHRYEPVVNPVNADAGSQGMECKRYTYATQMGVDTHNFWVNHVKCVKMMGHTDHRQYRCVDISDSTGASMHQWVGCPAGLFINKMHFRYDFSVGYLRTKMTCCSLT